MLLASTALFCGCLKNVHHETGVVEEVNDFTFSTATEGVSLDVEYTNTGVKAPVYFEVYDTCPVDLNSEKLNYVKLDGVLPILTGYTDANGKYTNTVNLPAYATKLYFYAPAFYARTLIEAEVKDGVVKVTDAVSDASVASASVMATTTVEHSSYMAEDCHKDINQIPVAYKNAYDTRWKCWLEKYDKNANGAVKNVCTNPDLLPKDPSNLFLTFHEALQPKGDKWSPGEAFINTQDIYMKEKGPISVTFLGQNTCFNNSIGYYYYAEGNAPTSLEQANIIMLFPNTQDGLWEKSQSSGNKDAAPSTGMKRNTTVQLKYYPNIASGSKDGETDTFPAGTRIGLVLATNAFSNRIGFVSGTNIKNRSTTTPGLSRDDQGNVIKNETRSVVFRVEDDVFVGFEEYKDDKNFTDCILSINTIPSDALVVEKVIKRENINITTKETAAVYAFEDLWPYQGDYDFNDVVVDYKRETIYTQGKKIAESFILKTYQNIAGNQNGLGVQLKKTGSAYSDNFQSQGSMTCLIRKKGSDVFEPVEMTYEPKDVNGNNRLPVYLITDNVQKDMGAEYKLTFTYNYAIDPDKTMSVEALPFLYRDLENGKRWEVHISKEKPTFKMDESLFGVGDDASISGGDQVFIRKVNGNGRYPFAIRLEGATVEDVKPLLDPANEMKRIDQIYPKYNDWCKNYFNAKYADWYKLSADTQQ